MNWTEMLQATQDEVNDWRGLTSLWEVFETLGGENIMQWDDRHVTQSWTVVNPIARRYLHDIRRLNLLDVQSNFTRAMVTRVENGANLTIGQTRGVLNVLGGGIKYNRGRFWKSRNRRRDRDDWLVNCMVCGGPLNTDVAVSRGIGDTCYRRVLGG